MYGNSDTRATPASSHRLSKSGKTAALDIKCLSSACIFQVVAAIESCETGQNAITGYCTNHNCRLTAFNKSFIL